MTITKRTNKDADALIDEVLAKNVQDNDIDIAEGEVMSNEELNNRLKISYQQYLDGKCSPVEEAFDRIKRNIERKYNVKL